MRSASLLACAAVLSLMGGCDRVCGDMHPEWMAVGEAGPDADADAKDDADADAKGDADAKVDTTTADLVDEDGVLTPIDSAAPDAGCTAGLYIMMDSAGSSNLMDVRWQSMVAAVSAFVKDKAHAGMLIGLDFFPEGDPTGVVASCNDADYLKPEVEIGPLPGTNDSRSKAIDLAIRSRNTRWTDRPFVAALRGALQHVARSQLQGVSVLLLTNGGPSGCMLDGNVDAVASVAGDYWKREGGAGATVPIRTYVLGVGAATDTLGPIAASGGTTKLHFVADAMSDASVSNITDELKSIVHQVCP